MIGGASNRKKRIERDSNRGRRIKGYSIEGRKTRRGSNRGKKTEGRKIKAKKTKVGSRSTFVVINIFIITTFVLIGFFSL